MPYDCRAYRVLIASPSDVEEERSIVVKQIQEWNDLRSGASSTVLLPVRWETHAAPDYGARPQQVINDRIVDDCDMLIGMFWTRIGTPTGMADGGTLEEINRVAKRGKPIMLYFSKRPVDPDKLDLNQMKSVEAFRESISKQSLSFTYRSYADFSQMLMRHLELKVRELRRLDTEQQDAPLEFAFASAQPRSLLGSTLTKQVTIPEITDLREALRNASEFGRSRVASAVKSRTRRSCAVPVALAIRNLSPSSIRNLYIEVEIFTSGGAVEILESSLHRGTILTAIDGSRHPIDEAFSNIDMETDTIFSGEGLAKQGTSWKFEWECGVLQPTRARFVQPELFVVPSAPTEVHFRAKMYSDNLRTPFSTASSLRVEVQRHQVTLREFIPEFENFLSVDNGDVVWLPSGRNSNGTL